MMVPQSGYFVVGYTELLSQTIVFVLFDAYNNYRIWKFSRRMIASLRKLSVKPVSRRPQNVKAFDCILHHISEKDFRRLPKNRGFRSKRRDPLDVLRQGAGADLCCYNGCRRMRILEREHQTLRQSSRPIRPANYPARSHHDMEIPE